MRKRTRDIAEEKRAYFRLLRYMLSESVKESYKADQTDPLPSRMQRLLTRLEDEPFSFIFRAAVIFVS